MTWHHARLRALIHRLLFAAIIGAFLDFLTARAGGRVGIVAIATPALAAWIITGLGETILLSFRLGTTRAWLPAAFTVGATAFSMAMLPLVLLAEIPAQTAFLICAGLALALSFVRRRPPALATADSDIAIAFGLALLVGFFCRRSAGAFPALLHDNVLPAWSDYFVHGTVIASFGDRLAIGQGDIMLAGAPNVFYHYGSFMLPAALAQLTHLPGLAVALAVLLPLGLLIGAYGLYALAVELASVGPALCAIWAVICLPDASRYFVLNGFYSFHWLLFTAPGSGYAIGTGAVACGCMLQWLRSRSLGPLLLGIALTFSLVMLRVHMFMLMAPAFVGTVILAAVRPAWRRPIIAATAVAILAASILLTGAAPESALPQFAQPFQFFKIALENGPAVYPRSLAYLNDHLGPSVGALAALVILLVASLGIWALAFPTIALLRSQAGRYRPVDMFPALLCASFVVLMLWAPGARNGDLTEYKQRHFVFLYAIVVLWSVLHLAQSLPLPAGWPRNNPALLFLAAVTITLLAFRDFDPGKPSLPFAQIFYANVVEPGLPEASAFIRAHSHPGDRLIVGGAPYAGHSYEPAVEIVSLADIPAYIGRAALQAFARPALAPLIEERAAAVAKVDDLFESNDAAFLTLRGMRVRWYVRIAPDLPRWDPTGSHAAFRSGALAVYDSTILNSGG